MRRFPPLRFVAFALIAALLLVGVAAAQDGDARYSEENPLRAAFIYVGPVGDAGWSYAHDIGRRMTEEALPFVETTFVESVPEAEVEPFIDQLVADGYEVIFATSFGYGDGVLAAAERYPEVIFGHATGIQRAPNVMTYIGEFYQVYYVNGLIAGALSETDEIGYVAAYPIPEVKRHINAFALGAREVNPDAMVDVRWLYAWFDPAGAQEATEALIAEGADVFAFSEDTPTVIQTAAGSGYPSYSHYASMLEFSPDTVVSGQLVRWETIYTDFLQGIQDGTYTNENLEDVDYFWLLADDAVEVGAERGMPINPLFEEELRAVTVTDPELGEISVYELVLERIEQMTEGGRDAFDPFTGPIEDRNGDLVVEEGTMPTVDELLSMQWAAPNVRGPWENEP